jgi:VCBS repeat-containing protein
LSQGRPVTADSSQTGNGNWATNGNDGSLSTRWAANDNLYPHWWRVDLGTNCNLSAVTIDWYGLPGRSYQYKIDVSTNDINYVTAVDQTGNTSTANTTDTFTATARYVRVTVTGVVPSGGNASFYECLVYGNVVPSVSLAPASIVATASGNTLALSWPADHLGWHLQVQTNALGTGLGTNWVTWPGSELVTGTNITINPANAAVLYRLISP